MKRPRRRTFSEYLVVSCAIALAAVAVEPSSEARARAAGQGWMVLFGSSSVNGSFGRLIEDDLSRLGFKVDRHGYSAAGVARPDFRDMRQILDDMPLNRTTTAVILYIGGNDAQAVWMRPEERPANKPDVPWIWFTDPRWSAFYEARATALIGSLCERGVQHTIVLPPADVTSPRLQGRLDRIRTLLKRAAEATECGHYVATAGDLGKFEIDGESLRTRDGVHMTRPGAVRVWNRIRDNILTLVRDSSAPVNVAQNASKRRQQSAKNSEPVNPNLGGL